jgi:hypothetical protein
VREALDRPWVLDIDASIKPLYGRQEGAEIGYNPAEPMRPSHVLDTFLVSNLRLVLDVRFSQLLSSRRRIVNVQSRHLDGGRPISSDLASSDAAATPRSCC